ncbi:hypothetical protein PV327_001756 [Microctonus hyperodae]|uniref:ERAP1-like C-terminal domain-containing protein n=1 Tax=Microctonus hyperodae TaxID=165561 RepID=A0AA39FEB3_MICHY|nr:hypothetical protein PV327_001756 [Microctonus hyperodae]
MTSFSKQRVLFNNEESTTNDKLDLIITISRAVVSQWVGILIYPESRSDFWVYRALAHYVADFMMETIEPTFRIRDSFLARTILWTRCDRDLDALTTIPFYLFDTWDDKMYFRREDYLGYQAMTIIAMIHEIYNFEDTGSVLKHALMRWGRHEFGPSQSVMMHAMTKQNVNKMINDWSKMPGIPVIHVTLDRTEQYAELIQERFNPSGPWNSDQFTWTIPIRCYNLSSNEYYHHWMERERSLSMKAADIKNCLLNMSTFVPYRINYPESWWLEIIADLKENPKNLSEMLKMRIIDDMLEFCVAGYIQISVIFDLLTYLSNEMDYFPWLAGAKALTKLRAILGTTRIENYISHFKQLTVNIVSNVYDWVEKEIATLPSPDDVKKNNDIMSHHYFRLHRKNILNIACGFGHEKCLNDAESRLKCYVDEVSSDECQNGNLKNLERDSSLNMS